MASLLNVYCGNCHKRVAAVLRDDSMSEIFGSSGKCPKCDKACIQNGQIILRDAILDEISVVKVVSKPVVKTVIKPPIAPKTTTKPPIAVVVGGKVAKTVEEKKPAPVVTKKFTKPIQERDRKGKR